jgi:hypothetical protein
MKEAVYDFPEKSDSLLKPTNRPGTSACIMRDRITGIPEWLGYIEGYKLAPQILYGYVCEENRDQEKLVYPILFLWQHYIEIVLKHLSISFCLEAFEEPKFERNHKLMDHWNHVRNQIEKHYGRAAKTEAEEWYNSVGAIITELCSLTTCDEGFRYPVNRAEQSSLDHNFRLIDLANIDQSMTKLGHLFECITTDLENRRK